jgi:heat shock protein HtpX
MRLALYLILGAGALYANATILAHVLDALGVFYLTAVAPKSFIEGYLVVGAVGALVSWRMAKSVAGWSLNMRPYEDGHVRGGNDLRAVLAGVVSGLGMRRAPALAIYDSPHANAFALDLGLGGTEIAVSTGLVEQLSATEAEAVLAHTAAKLASRDVLTLQLLRGSINPVTIMPTRMFSLLMGTSPRTADEETPVDAIEDAMRAVLELALAPVSGLLARHFARSAERRADARVARTLGRERLLSVLGGIRAPSSAATREMFTMPLAFTARVRRGLRLVSHHNPLACRAVALSGTQVGRPAKSA